MTISFVSLGFVVLDEIHFGSQKPFTDVVGGSEAYGMSWVIDSIKDDFT